MGIPAVAGSTRAIRQATTSRCIMQGKKQQVHGAAVDASWWVPHPRTGIYYPKGHEWVMEDVPEGASSFPATYWLRSSEGVEKADSDFSGFSSCGSYDHPFLGITKNMNDFGA